MSLPRVVVPPPPLTGGCQCGNLRYSLNGDPLIFYLCHCTECQRHTSSAFGESLRVRRDDLSIEGRCAMVRRTAESGRIREGLFCPDCGVRIVHLTVGADQANIKAGTLDDTSWLVPAGHIWTRSKQAFMALGPDDLVYPMQPDDGYAALKARWQGMLAKS